MKLQRPNGHNSTVMIKINKSGGILLESEPQLHSRGPRRKLGSPTLQLKLTKIFHYSNLNYSH